MPRLVWFGWLALIAPCWGCGAPWLMVRQPNPVFVPVADPERVWNTLVDVVDDHFNIEREERVRVVDNMLVNGRITTYPEPSSAIIEFWRGDTVTFYDKLESTFQSYRRRAEVEVTPVEGGFQVQLTVFKELEDVPKPVSATAGAGTLRHDTSQRHVKMAIGQQPTVTGWIPQGRDPNLEQKMLNKLLMRLGVMSPWTMIAPGPLPYAAN